MKKNCLSSICSLLIAVIFLWGCQKETREQAITETETESMERSGGGDKNECRMINLTYDGGEYNYHYNRRGLADEWDIKDYGLFKQEYNVRGRITRSRLYVEGVLQNTIEFFYENNRPLKEIWYIGNTSEKYDEVFYTYNRKGQMTRVESFMLDYYTVSTYTKDGNIKSWEFYSSGIPYISGYYKYIQQYKNPYLSVKGIEHGFPFINPSINSTKWWPASEKIVMYDENNEPVVVYDFDPLQTVWQCGNQNYPSSVTYFDLISETWYPPYTFDYENCGRKNSNLLDNSRMTHPSSTASGNVNPILLLKRNPSISIKEQANEIRRKLKKINK